MSTTAPKFESETAPQHWFPKKGWLRLMSLIMREAGLKRFPGPPVLAPSDSASQAVELETQPPSYTTIQVPYCPYFCIIVKLCVISTRVPSNTLSLLPSFPSLHSGGKIGGLLSSFSPFWLSSAPCSLIPPIREQDPECYTTLM